jgi:hypothetical protein
VTVLQGWFVKVPITGRCRLAPYLRHLVKPTSDTNVMPQLTEAGVGVGFQGVLDEYKEMIAGSETVATEKLSAIVDSLKDHMKGKPVHLLVGESGAMAAMLAAVEAFSTSTTSVVKTCTCGRVHESEPVFV